MPLSDRQARDEHPEGFYEVETFGMTVPIAVMVVTIVIGAVALPAKKPAGPWACSWRTRSSDARSCSRRPWRCWRCHRRRICHLGRGLGRVGARAARH